MKKIVLITTIVLFISCQKNNEFVPESPEILTAITLQSNANIAQYNIADADYVVANTQELLDALQLAQPGEIVFIDGNANLKIEDEVSIPAGIVLASDRNTNGVQGLVFIVLKKIKDFG